MVFINGSSLLVMQTAQFWYDMTVTTELTLLADEDHGN